MGVKNLWDILESCKKTLPLHHLQNKRLCVDLSCWLIQFQNAGKLPAAANDKPYLRNLFHRLRTLIALNCTLIFVTDGSIPSIKLSAYRRRLRSSLETAEDEPLACSQTVGPLRRNMGSEFSRMIKEAKVLGLALGIPCLDGLEEGEAQCALLNYASLCDGCFSADSDIFLFGARTVYRDIFLGEGGYVICYDMVDIEKKLGFGRNSLISLALLLGSDYSQKVYGCGPESACRFVRAVGDDAILNQILSKGLTIPRSKGKKKHAVNLSSDANKENLISYYQNIKDMHIVGSKEPFLQVIDAYLKPKCHSAESEAVESACTDHPFRRAELQKICELFFGWSPDKTDQYILPKVAERDLRRFANLRATSSEIGANIPLLEMPVECPVSAVVKQRKVQGRECFEVAWRDFYGLQTSVVPADLVECACPEKMQELMDRKCEGRKHKKLSKPRKPSKADLSQMGTQLQGLLLNTESQSIPSLETTTSHESSVQVELLSMLIDLSSPSPPPRACKLAKRSQSNADGLVLPTDGFGSLVIDVVGDKENSADNVVDVHGSDSDVSPVHEEKVRQLRLFLDSIRSELY